MKNNNTKTAEAIQNAIIYFEIDVTSEAALPERPFDLENDVTGRVFDVKPRQVQKIPLLFNSPDNIARRRRYHDILFSGFD